MAAVRTQGLDHVAIAVADLVADLDRSIYFADPDEYRLELTTYDV
jgi:hypothetical protein